jgi:hypothetical protein
MLKTEKSRNKIPGTPTVTEQKKEMRNVSHKKTKPGNPAVRKNPQGSNRQNPVKTLALPGPAYLSCYFFSRYS